MKEELFRKKSLEKFQAPETLNDYVRVTSPAVWLLLGAMIALLVGAVVWGIFGSVNTVVKADAHVSDGKVVCVVDAAGPDNILVGMPVKIGDALGSIRTIAADDEGGHVYVCDVDMPQIPEDGIYAAQILVGSTHPISFVVN